MPAMPRRAARGILAVLLLVLPGLLPGQASSPLPEFDLDRVDVETHVRVLAADAMQGRMTGTPGNEQAASYIAAHFAAYGLQPPPGQDGPFQYLEFRMAEPAARGRLDLGGASFTAGEDLVLLAGAATDRRAEVVFAGHGWVDAAAGHDDYAGLDVAGKLVVVLPGTPEQNDARSAFRLAARGSKQREAHRRGAAGLIELARFRMNWPVFRQVITRPSRQLLTGEPLPESFVYAWIDEGEADLVERIAADTRAHLVSSGVAAEYIRSPNVAGVLEGVDPDLRDEYVVVSAHFDHVGTGPGGDQQDSIFNGARDNAMGVAALLATARSLAARPPRRSVLFLAFTAEEIGLVGSQFYVDHPLVPLEQTVFNLNTDGAGYNDTGKVTVIGYGRTTADEQLEAGSRPFGLEILPDPMPEQNLYERSDNAPFARAGVPAVTVSPGITAFDERIRAHYHQVSDEADSLDFGYVLRYCQTMAHMARALADSTAPPAWAPGHR